MKDFSGLTIDFTFRKNLSLPFTFRFYRRIYDYYY